MRISLHFLIAILTTYQAYATPYSDNLCSTPCEYCCRNGACQSKDTCQGKGAMKPLVIVGIVAGVIVGLILLRVIWVKWIREKCMGRAPRQGEEPAARSRPRATDENEKKKKKKKAPLKKKKTGVSEGGKKSKSNKGDHDEKKNKASAYDPLAGNSISTPNDSVVNRYDGNNISVTPPYMNDLNQDQDLENPIDAADNSIVTPAPQVEMQSSKIEKAKPKQKTDAEMARNKKPEGSRNNISTTGKERSSSKGKPSGQKSGTKMSSSNMQKSTQDRSRSKDRPTSSKPRSTNNMEKSPNPTKKRNNQM